MIHAFRAVGFFFSRNVQTAFAGAPFLSGACVALALAGVSCAKDPTEVVVTVFSDVPCDATVAVAAGPVGELGERPASAISTVCDPNTGSRGALVLVPKASDSGELAVEVRIRTDQGQPDDCVASNNYLGCIVSRRILNYIPERTVHMRIDLRNPCLNTPCSQTTSCVAQGLSKACVTAHIDPNQCSGECTDADLVTQSGSELDVCGEGSNPCSDQATCLATSDGASCVCGEGYGNPAGDAVSCVDVNECALTASPCDAHATCKNSEGGFSCTCKPAYQGNGKTCKQTKCETACGDHATCIDDRGSFACACDEGFSGDGVTCTDIDECQGNAAHCDPLAACTNSAGSFTCKCPDGYGGDGTTCSKLDQCKIDPDCTAPAVCVTDGEALACQCPAGYLGDGTTCTDKDECALMTANCGTNAECVNAPGSYSCQCLPDFTGDPTTACTCDTSVNFSLLATPSASTTYSGYDVKHINDGNPTTEETPAQSWTNVWPVAFPQWVELDYPSERTVGRVEMYSSDGYPVMAYDIAYWDASTSTWPVLQSVTGNESVHNTVSFTPVRTSKLRLVAKTGAKDQYIYARVNELESYCQ